MNEIDYSSNYDFNLDPFIENKDADNKVDDVPDTPENNESKEELKKAPPKQNNGCRLLLIVLIYLIIVESKLNYLIDNLVKKILFIGILWTFGYDLVNKLIGFEKNVCKYLF